MYFLEFMREHCECGDQSCELCLATELTQELGESAKDLHAFWGDVILMLSDLFRRE